MDYSIITLFKNVTPSYFTFRNFYKNVWNVNEFIYIIGYNNSSNYEFIKKNYINSLGKGTILQTNYKYNHDYFNNLEIVVVNNNNINNIFLLYKTSENCNINNFNVIKSISFNLILQHFINIEKRRYISVDDDEFLFSSDMENLKFKILNNNFHRFHFMEIICEDINNIRDLKNLKWSFQSWFTHRMNDNEIKYNCSACKTFLYNPYNFKNHNMKLGFWFHSGNNYYDNSTCNLFNNSSKKDDKLLEDLKKNGICYHFTAFTYSYLKYIKLQNRFKTNNNEGNYKDIEKQYKDVSKYYDTINDNELIKYFDENDINIYN